VGHQKQKEDFVTTSNMRILVCCPFHDEQTPSCYFDMALTKFHCFGCGKEGTFDEFHAGLHVKHKPGERISVELVLV
jgi:hypothetical protein